MMPPSTKDVDAMKRVLNNLNAVTDPSIAPTPTVSASKTESKAMLDILTKLSKVNKQTQETIMESSNTRAKQLATTQHTEQGVSIANYLVSITESELHGSKRNIYSIIDTVSNKTLYQDITLYESVMAITKQLLAKKQSAEVKCEEIYQLDLDYARYLHEASALKQRIKTVTDSDRKCLYENKYSRTLGLAKEVKRNILKSY